MTRILPTLRHAKLAAVVPAGLAFLVVLAIYAVAQSPGKEEPSGVVAVKRSAIVSTVSADGNVESPRELSLGLERGGRLVEVAVREGDHVRRGQLLARVDDVSESAALGSAQANLASARERLEQTQSGLTTTELASRQRLAEQSRVAVGNAQRDLADARNIARRNLAGLRGAVQRARVSGEEADLRASELRLAQERSRADRLRQRFLDVKTRLARDRVQLENELERLHDAENETPPDEMAINNAGFKVDVVRSRISAEESDEATAKADQDTATATVRTYVSQVDTNRIAVREARRRLGDTAGSLNNGIASAQQQIDSARASLSTSQAQLGVTLAQNRVDAQVKTADVAAGVAGVAQADAALADARKALGDTQLRAPVDGVVGHIDAKVGELVRAGVPLAASAPAPQPVAPSDQGSGAGADSGSGDQSAGADSGDGSASESGSTGAAAGSAGGAAPSGGLITLAQTRELQVKANFNETDAARVHTGDRAAITVDAFPDRRFVAHVASIDPIDTLVNNVVTYEVTLVLDGDTAGLKPGMTSTADVTVARADDALVVPRTAVRSPQGATPTVTVVTPDGKPQARLVVTGLQSDSSVQILGGVGVGERVLRTIAASPDMSG